MANEKYVKNIYLDKREEKALKRWAKAKGVTVMVVIRLALAKYLKLPKPDVAVAKVARKPAKKTAKKATKKIVRKRAEQKRRIAKVRIKAAKLPAYEPLRPAPTLPPHVVHTPAQYPGDTGTDPNVYAGVSVCVPPIGVAALAPTIGMQPAVAGLPPVADDFPLNVPDDYPLAVRPAVLIDRT